MKKWIAAAGVGIALVIGCVVAVSAPRISDASTIVLLNGGHYIHYEHPEKVITAIGDMLNSLLK